MRYAIYIPPNTKDLAIKPNDGCLWKPVKRNSARASKQLRFVAITEAFNGNQAIQERKSVAIVGHFVITILG